MKFPPSSCVALPPCATKRKPPDFQAASWETVGCTAISAPGNYLTIWSSKKWPLVKLKSSTPLLKCLSSSSPSSLPKWKKSSVYPPLQQLLPWQVLLPPAMRVAMLPSRPNLISFSPTSVPTRSASLKLSAKSPVWASRMPKIWLMAHPSPSRKACPRKKLRKLRRNLKKPAPKSSSSKALIACPGSPKGLPGLLRFQKTCLISVVQEQADRFSGVVNHGRG